MSPRVLLFGVCCLLFVAAEKLIKRVAIVGGGTAGLGLAAALTRLPSGVDDVTVFEARANFLQQSLGGGVQINGGAAVLEKLGLLPELERVAQRMGAVRSRNRYGAELLQLDIFSSVLTKAASELCADGGSGAPMVYSIMRDALQRLLYDATQAPAMPAAPRVNVRGSMRCVGAREDVATGKIALAFDDGKEEEGFDVVFAADGVGSTLRALTGGDRSLLDPVADFYAAMSAPPGDKASSAPVAPAAAPSPRNGHTGLRITYAVTPDDDAFALRPGGKNIFHQWFGDGCYALTASYGGLTGVQHMVALVYRDDRDEENAAWAQEDVSRGPKTVLLERLRRAGLADNEELLTLVKACDEGRVVDLGVRDRTVPLLSWAAGSGRVILVGDSAHAMAPFLGQGANQALQDAYFLAQGICAINGQDPAAAAASSSSAVTATGSEVQRASVALQRLASSYQWRRKLPTALIGGKAKILGTIETAPGLLGGLARDAFFFAMGKLGVAEYVYLDGARPKPPLK